MKLQEALNSIKQRQIEEAQSDLIREQNAVNAIMPVINLLHETFENLKGWDKPTYFRGVANSRYWMEGQYGHVYMDINSDKPERVWVYVKDHELGLFAYPLTESGLSHLVMAVAERMTLSCAKEMTTLHEKLP